MCPTRIDLSENVRELAFRGTRSLARSWGPLSHTLEKKDMSMKDFIAVLLVGAMLLFGVYVTIMCIKLV